MDASRVIAYALVLRVRVRGMFYVFVKNSLHRGLYFSYVDILTINNKRRYV